MTAVQSRAPLQGLPDGLAEDLAAASLALARRLHAGGTLWCASPSWPHHAQHVAVEFVHPVVVGKPALAAAALSSHGLVPTARANVRSGDVVLVVARAGEPLARELARRAGVWGATTVWIGAGRRPDAGAADHVLWLPEDERAEHDGRFVLLYHLLWELAHVCLEHGLAAQTAQAAPGCEAPVCTTCSDEGRLAEVVRTAGSTAVVRTPDGEEEVDLSLVGSAEPDDLLVVHAGMAITRLQVSA